MSLRLVGRLNYAKLAVLDESAAAGPRIHLDCISEDIYRRLSNDKRCKAVLPDKDILRKNHV